MSWEDRLRQMVLAGGVLFAGCGGENLSGAGGAGGNNGTGGATGNPFVCGNAAPDPCICGRPDADPTYAAQCQAEIACTATGGTWIAYYLTDATGTHPPHCEIDGATIDDGGFDGSAAD